MRNESFHLFLQLGDRRFLFLNLAILLLHFPMLFEKLVEQHRVHLVVAHGVNLAVLVAHDEVGIYLSYFLGNQAKLRCVFLAVLVVECHGSERQDRFAGIVHRLDVTLESARGRDRPELTVCVHQHW